MPLRVVAALFPDEAHARRAIAAMFAAGKLTLIDAEGCSSALAARHPVAYQHSVS